MSGRHRRSNLKGVASGAAALLSLAALLSPTPASATVAVFLPKGSSARVERQHLTVSIQASGTVVWDAVDISDGSADVGVIVAVRAGGRIEVTGRIWIDVLERATEVKVSGVAPGDCRPRVGGQIGGNLDAGASGSSRLALNGKASGGCNGSERASDGGTGGGCYSNSPESGGCNGCGSCKGIEPSDNGHPGCSAFTACGPYDPSSSSGSNGNPPRSSTERVGPYEQVRVRTADGSARRWLEANGYEPGTSFDEGAAAVEQGGYELYAMRAQSPTPSSLVQSLRVVSTSTAIGLPLRLVRMGGGGALAATPLTLLVLASAPQRIVDVNAMRVDESRLAFSGPASNYESLVSALLGGAGDAAGDAGSPTRWMVESAQSVSNRVTPAGSEGGTSSEPSSFADRFRAQCIDRTPEKHTICASATDGGATEDDGGADPGDAGSSASDASADADSNDAAPASDGGTDSPEAGASTPGCREVDRRPCDDIDLAILPNETTTVTRFRGMVGGDPAAIADLVFTPSPELLPDGRYFVRTNGQAGTCEAPAGATSDDDETTAQTCRQMRTRPGSALDLGPLALFVVAIRVVVAIMRRARR
jgi:hypothetical protein